jgi:hypothetical protein
MNDKKIYDLSKKTIEIELHCCFPFYFWFGLFYV